MKKIALLLAMLICLVPVLGACGANSSPEKAVEAALKVVYGDGDEKADDFYAVAYEYNLDILELIKNDEEASALKESVREAQKSIKDSLNNMEDIDEYIEEAKYDDFDFNYEILYCNIYEEKDGENFDNLIESFGYVNTDIEDAVTAIAKVGVMMTTEYVYEDENYTNVSTETITCYCIDGDWYIER